LRVGAALSYAQTDVDGRGAGSSKLDINSLQVTLYGGYTSDDFYIDGSLGYAENETDSTRGIRFGILDRVASASYDSDQIMANIGVGMPIDVGGAYLTPNAGFNYTIVSTDTYTETGAGNLNLTVATDDAEMMIGSIGARLHSRIESETFTVIPEIHANARYDFEGDKARATASFTGGGAAFVTEGAEVEQFGYNVGGGLSVEDNHASLGISYDLEKKSDFVGHSATLQGRVKF
jgi:outer membrane autotransporter protein